MRLARNAVKMLMKDNWCLGNSDNPNVSVVISAYNEEGYIGRAIDSVLAQGYKASGITVVDDGSTDRTYEIASGYADDGVRVLRTENLGISHARNYGAENANGDIVVWMDADSCMEEGLLQKVVSRARSGYVGGTARTRPDTNGSTESFIYKAANTVAKTTGVVANFIDGNINRLTEGGFMYCRRDAIDGIREKYGELFPEGTSEDRAFAYRMAEEGPTSRITDTGIVTSSRRVRKNGLVGSVADQLQRSFTPAGIPHDGYEVIREAA